MDSCEQCTVCTAVLRHGFSQLLWRTRETFQAKAIEKRHRKGDHRRAWQWALLWTRQIVDCHLQRKGNFPLYRVLGHCLKYPNPRVLSVLHERFREWTAHFAPRWRFREYGYSRAAGESGYLSKPAIYLNLHLALSSTCRHSYSVPTSRHIPLTNLLGRRYIPRSPRSGYSWFRSGHQAKLLHPERMCLSARRRSTWCYVRTGLQLPQTSEIQNS